MKSTLRPGTWIAWALVVLLLTGCGSFIQPETTATITPTPTDKPTITNTTTSTPTHTQTPTLEPTQTLEPSPTLTSTITPSATATPEFGLLFHSIGDDKMVVELIFDDISIEFPESWHVVYIDPHSPVLSEEILDRYKYEILLQLEEKNRDFILVGYDAGTVPQVYGRDPTIMMTKVDFGFPVTLDYFDMEVVQYLREVLEPDATITHDKVDLSGHQAVEFIYQDKYIDPSASDLVDVMVYRYVLVDDSNVYAYWLSCPCQVSDKYEKIFQQIGRSFKLNQ